MFDSSISSFLADVPPYLSERCRPLNDRAGWEQESASRTSPTFVLYWMRTAIRWDENPALEVALAFARRLGTSVFVYHALSEKYPFASDRHHTFVLEAVRDLQRRTPPNGVAYGFHLERRGHRGPHLRTILRQARVTVTEDMPVEPLRRLTEQLARTVACPMIAVDTACVVPMQQHGRAFDRAFAFRDATHEAYAERLRQPPLLASTWDPGAAATGLSELPELPFQPLDVRDTCLDDLIRQCDVDHSVGPIRDTPGGTTAGYARWTAFRDGRLVAYAADRNDALRNGVSRMSPYLHYGMVAPMRLAREAAAVGGAGAEKYLDELLIWRELAYAFCFFRRDHGRLTALPQWARATLAEHAEDRRPALFSWETLARAATGDALWDAAQRSLLMRGELHNNLRMTWGKMLVPWTRDARAALSMLIDLNHRYALDGQDPASYGGLLWCLGQFDRPFAPPRPIWGTVRPRSTEEHARRLDPEAYGRRVAKIIPRQPPRVAVIGAGISGLICARTLADQGRAVTVFEKSRGVGGRLATRRADGGIGYDHGAQYFSARDPRFRRHVRSWHEDGIVEAWKGRVVDHFPDHIVDRSNSGERYVAVPGMSALGKHLARDLEVLTETQVTSLERDGERWSVLGPEAARLGAFDIVVISAPARQSAQLLQPISSIGSRAASCEMRSCWALMLTFADGTGACFDGAFVHQSPIAWMARNSSKPGRAPAPETWVAHASSTWSLAYLECDPTEVQRHLSAAVSNVLGLPSRVPDHVAAHRWRYSIPAHIAGEDCLSDAAQRLVACGDWCRGTRVEDAFLSGMAAAGQVLAWTPHLA